MSYIAQTTVVVHTLGTYPRPGVRTALLAPLPGEHRHPQMLHPIEELIAPPSDEAISGGIYTGELRVDITRVADWFTGLPWTVHDTAVLTSNDGENTVTVAVANGHVTRLTGRLYDVEPPTVTTGTLAI